MIMTVALHMWCCEGAELVPQPQIRLNCCSTCAGSEATLADLEELCQWAGLEAASVGCMGACGAGPNVSIQGPPTTEKPHGSYQLHTGVGSLQSARELVELALGKPVVVPAEAARRIQLRSEAMRLMHTGDQGDLNQCQSLLTQAIEAEASTGLEPASSSRLPKVVQLRMLRAEANSLLGDNVAAVADLDAVIQLEPRYAQPWVDNALILRHNEQSTALLCLRAAHELGSSPAELGLTDHMRVWVRKIMTQIEDRLHEDTAMPRSGLSAGDGSGRWQVDRIEGMSPDTCLYHLSLEPPTDPHLFPQCAWHVNVRFGDTVRAYTPISSVCEWERGRMALLVKTYSTGKVSKSFAMLRQATQGPAEQCTVLVSAPVPTLTLPPVLAVERVTHIALVVGGTGIAAALQILSALVTGDCFPPECTGTLLYSSRTALDVLCVDQLQELVTTGRVRAVHTLTEHPGPTKLAVYKRHPASAYGWVHGRHFHFVSCPRRSRPLSGPETDPLTPQESMLRGRIDKAMLDAEIPEPGPGMLVVVCGPDRMGTDVRDWLMASGHHPENLTELAAFDGTQIQERHCQVVESNAMAIQGVDHDSDSVTKEDLFRFLEQEID